MQLEIKATRILPRNLIVPRYVFDVVFCMDLNTNFCCCRTSQACHEGESAKESKMFGATPPPPGFKNGGNLRTFFYLSITKLTKHRGPWPLWLAARNFCRRPLWYSLCCYYKQMQLNVVYNNIINNIIGLVLNR